MKKYFILCISTLSIQQFMQNFAAEISSVNKLNFADYYALK